MKKLICAAAILAAASITNAQMLTNAPVVSVKVGRALFLKNCAHCHGADAHGDDGPDLHDLDWTDKEISDRIRKGKKGQMTSFAGKLKTTEIESIVAYLRTLK
ncbi:MAG TPA: cytochrome c [Verrucomicrobiae bacterium]|nr:cytochrome c [Verrucomicrobiae bacterium]